jgi:hypothetical protein
MTVDETFAEEGDTVSHHDEGLIDKVKNVLGMGDDHDHADDRGIDMEQPPDDASPQGVEPIGQIDGAAEVAAARQGVAGGMGATGAMGGAGAADPTGSIGREGDETDTTGPTADPGDVKTEYEMGHEFDPDHERIAESGVSRAPEERVQP